MDREELCKSLITWLKTFNLEKHGDTIEDLTDGVILSKILNAIAPSFFNEAWMSKVKSDSTTNWRIKISNLKKILKGILEYYSEILEQQIQEFHMPDVTLIGEKNDPVEMSRLLQLILGCAVNCADKQEYIQVIMSMEEDVQHMVMQAIQELMTAPTSPSGAGTEAVEQLKKAVEDLNRALEEKEEISQRCHELDSQIAVLQDEKCILEGENEKLNERLLQSNMIADPSTPAGKSFQQLQNLVEQLQEEVYRNESEKEDYRIKADIKDKEILDMHRKNDDLTALAEEARNLKDDNDVLRHTADKVSKFELTIESLKKKLEGKSDLEGQLKILEEKNTTLIQTHMELEEEVRKMGMFKSQLELYKRQVQELQLKSSEETKRADKAAFEAKRNAEKVQTLQREKESLKEDNTRLVENIDNLTGAKAEQAEVQGSGFDESGLMGLPMEVKEKLIRLQLENKRLQKSSSESESTQLLQSMLDDVNVRNDELQTEVRLSNQRIMSLEAEAEDLRDSQTSESSGGAQVLRTLNDQMQKNKQLNTELQKKQTALDELEPTLLGKDEEIRKLDMSLGEKDKEMKQMEERYKRYLEKAKSVIHSLNPKKSSTSEPELLSLRNQVSEKDRFIEHIEKEHERTKNIREQEEKLMVTAWYNLGMQLHRKASEERLIQSSGGQSFLARQRQAQTRRVTSLNTPAHLNSR